MWFVNGVWCVGVSSSMVGCCLHLPNVSFIDSGTQIFFSCCLYSLVLTSELEFFLIFLHLVFTSLPFHANSRLSSTFFIVWFLNNTASYNGVTANTNLSLRFLITHQRYKFVNPQPYLMKWHISVFTLWSLSLRGKLFVFSCIDRKILQHLNTDSSLWIKERWRASTERHISSDGAAFTKPRTL